MTKVYIPSYLSNVENVDGGFQLLLEDIMLNGEEINTRNSLCKRIFNQKIVFDSTPLVSVRRTAWLSAIKEMEWFLSGSSNINDLHESVRKWWQPWTNKNGEIHNNYSKQFRYFTDDLFDQIAYLQNAIKNHPYGRRSVITTWNTAEMASSKTSITNCHGSLIQAFVDNNNKLHLTMYQRSSDMVLGLPHNWIQYWAMLQWLAHNAGRDVGTLTWLGGDCHIYECHFEAANEIINVGTSNIQTPKLIYSPSSKDFKASDFSLEKEYAPIIKKSLPMVV
jgi:thymidylate synthase